MVGGEFYQSQKIKAVAMTVNTMEKIVSMSAGDLPLPREPPFNHTFGDGGNNQQDEEYTNHQQQCNSLNPFPRAGRVRPRRSAAGVSYCFVASSGRVAQVGRFGRAWQTTRLSAQWPRARAIVVAVRVLHPKLAHSCRPDRAHQVFS